MCITILHNIIIVYCPDPSRNILQRGPCELGPNTTPKPYYVELNMTEHEPTQLVIETHKVISAYIDAFVHAIHSSI